MSDDDRLFTRQLTRGQLIGLDALAAAAYTLVVAAMMVAQAPGDSGATDGAALGSVPMWARWLVVLAMGLPLAIRRLRPVAAFAVVFGASLIALIAGIVRDDFVGAAFVLYLVAAVERMPRREPTAPIAALSLVGIVVLIGAGSPVPIPDLAASIVTGAVVLGAAWTIGRAVRERRRFAERAAAQRVQQAVAEERLRIARDLHDIVAHGLSLIVVKAATANHVIDARPQEAEDALQVIESTGRSAIGEMRQMLDVLRDDRPPAAEDLQPAPGLAELTALGDRVAMAGVSVELDLQGTDALPSGMALTVYRIVQEALTNVVKHAAPAHCRVSVVSSGGEIRVEVLDDGQRAGARPGSWGETIGHGLIGMRERVRLLGGELTSGPIGRRGFRVAARIPTPGAEGAVMDGAWVEPAVVDGAMDGPAGGDGAAVEPSRPTAP